MVNPETQSDEWVVNFKSWVVNYTCYNIQTDIILELSNSEMQITCHFQLAIVNLCPVN